MEAVKLSGAGGGAVFEAHIRVCDTSVTVATEAGVGPCEMFISIGVAMFGVMTSDPLLDVLLKLKLRPSPPSHGRPLKLTEELWGLLAGLGMKAVQLRLLRVDEGSEFALTPMVGGKRRKERRVYERIVSPWLYPSVPDG
jgi:hypothetical protein